MGLQFQHIFPGKRVRRRKVNRQPLVDGVSCDVAERQISGLTRVQAAAKQRLYQRLQLLAADPHNAHGPPAGRRGNGQNGIVVATQHREREAPQALRGEPRIWAG